MSEHAEHAARLREHPLTRFAGTHHVFDLEELDAQLRAEARPAERGHRQVTILHHGATAMVLFAFEAGGEIPHHKVNGLVTIHVLSGALTVAADGQAHDLGAGQLLVLSPGVPHSVTAREASRMLLTVHLEQQAATPERAA